jgi:hypothetical protein
MGISPQTIRNTKDRVLRCYRVGGGREITDEYFALVIIRKKNKK